MKKLKDVYVYKNLNFDMMNKAYFEDLKENTNNKNKYLLMTEQELSDCGFFDKYPHLR
jgi:hypothetical protein